MKKQYCKLIEDGLIGLVTLIGDPTQSGLSCAITSEWIRAYECAWT